jgi:hypothetical protein
MSAGLEGQAGSSQEEWLERQCRVTDGSPESLKRRAKARFAEGREAAAGNDPEAAFRPPTDKW